MVTRSLVLSAVLLGCSSSSTEVPAGDAAPDTADAIGSETNTGCPPNAGPICCEPGRPPAEPTCTGTNAWQCPLGTIAVNRATGCPGADAGPDS